MKLHPLQSSVVCLRKESCACSVPDTPDWKPYRDFVYKGQQNFLNHTSNSEHLLDANVPQVSLAYTDGMASTESNNSCKSAGRVVNI